VAIDYQAEGLLDGLDGEAREARLDLLRRLNADGVPLEELKRAADEGRLALLPVERALAGEGRRYTQEQIAEQSGLDADFLGSLWRALGVALPAPEEAAFGEDDLESARAVRRFRDAGIPDEGILEIARVLSQGMANAAAAIGRVFAEAFLRPGDTELDAALRYAEATRALAPHMQPTLVQVFNLQQREQVRRATADQARLASGRPPGAETIAVCFADLVGFTRLGERIPAEDLGAVAGRLAVLAAEIASPPVRLVKTIGDAAMLVSPDTDALLETALSLVDAAHAEGEGFPEVHAGLARGEALGRSGDWYGRPVNLASRVTDIARPGSVLATGEVRDAAEGEYRWSFAGERRLKGLKGEVKLFRVRRAEVEEG
jgi:adenylate cyclase